MVNFFNNLFNRNPAAKSANEADLEKRLTELVPPKPAQSEQAASFLHSMRRPETRIDVLDPSEWGSIKSYSQFQMDFINDTGGYGGNPNPYPDNQLLGAYMSSVYLYAAIRRVANLVGRVKVKAQIKQGDKFVNAPESALVNQIFARNGSAMLSEMYLNYAIFGTAVMFKVPTYKAVVERAKGNMIYHYRDGAVKDLEVLDKPKWELDEEIGGDTIRGIFVNRGNQDLPNYLTKEEIIFFTAWNPLNRNRGRSIVTHAIHEAVTNYRIARWSAEYFTRGAMPYVLLSLEDDPATLTDTDLYKYKRQLEERYASGVDSSLRSSFIDRKVSVNQIGIPASEIGAPEINEAALEGIAAAVGIDRELIVAPAGGSQERYGLMIQNAWKSTVKPFVEELIAAIGLQIGLPDNMQLVADTSDIEELEADRGERASTEISIMDAGLQTFNEARQRLNMVTMADLDGFFKIDGQLISINRIIRQDNLLDEKMLQQISSLWEGDLLPRSAIMQMMGRELPEGEDDGYKSQVTKLMEFEHEYRVKMLDHELAKREKLFERQIEEAFKGNAEVVQGELDGLLDPKVGKQLAKLNRSNQVLTDELVQQAILERQRKEAEKLAKEQEKLAKQQAKLGNQAPAADAPEEDLGAEDDATQADDSPLGNSPLNTTMLRRFTPNAYVFNNVGAKIFSESADGLEPIETVPFNYPLEIAVVTQDRRWYGVYTTSKRFGWVQAGDVDTHVGADSFPVTNENPLFSDNVHYTNDPREIISPPIDVNKQVVLFPSQAVKNEPETLDDLFPPLVVPVAENEAYVCVWLANNPKIKEIQDHLKHASGYNSDIEWQEPSTYHITLIYVKEINDEQLQRVISRLPKTIEDFEIDLNGLAYFANEHERVAYLMVSANYLFFALQRAIYDAFKQEGVEISEYSIPADYHPHVTMAYLPYEVEWSSADYSTQVVPLKVVVQRDGYKPVHEILFNRNDPSVGDDEKARQDSPFEELDAWERKAIRKGVKKGKNFEPFHLRTDLYHNVRDGLQTLEESEMNGVQVTPDQIKSVFGKVRSQMIVENGGTPDE